MEGQPGQGYGVGENVERALWEKAGPVLASVFTKPDQRRPPCTGLM